MEIANTRRRPRNHADGRGPVGEAVTGAATTRRQSRHVKGGHDARARERRVRSRLHERRGDHPRGGPHRGARRRGRLGRQIAASTRSVTGRAASAALPFSMPGKKHSDIPGPRGHGHGYGIPVGKMHNTHMCPRISWSRRSLASLVHVHRQRPRRNLVQRGHSWRQAATYQAW